MYESTIYIDIKSLCFSVSFLSIMTKAFTGFRPSHQAKLRMVQTIAILSMSTINMNDTMAYNNWYKSQKTFNEVFSISYDIKKSFYYKKIFWLLSIVWDREGVLHFPVCNISKVYLMGLLRCIQRISSSVCGSQKRFGAHFKMYRLFRMPSSSDGRHCQTTIGSPCQRP